MTGRKNKNSQYNKEVKVVDDVIVLDEKCILDYSKYKCKDSNNRFLVAEMFDDHKDNKRSVNKISPYSLYNTEHVETTEGEVIYSISKIFIESGDSTGYTCAMKCFGSWEHWSKIVKNKLVATEVSKWVAQIKIKQLALIEAACVDKIIKKDRTAMQASKLLISINDQDPNSHNNRDRLKAEELKKQEDEDEVVANKEISDEEHRMMMEDFKRLNG